MFITLCICTEQEALGVVYIIVYDYLCDSPRLCNLLQAQDGIQRSLYLGMGWAEGHSGRGPPLKAWGTEYDGAICNYWKRRWLWFNAPTPPPRQEVSSERGFIRKERLRRPFRSWTPEQGKGEVTWKRVGHKKWPRIHTTIHAIGSMVWLLKQGQSVFMTGGLRGVKLHSLLLIL